VKTVLGVVTNHSIRKLVRYQQEALRFAGSLRKIPDWFLRRPIGDLPLHILNLCNSGHDRIGFMDGPIAVYRRHCAGMRGGNRRSQNSERLLQA
jgi:hypothetical protein